MQRQSLLPTPLNPAQQDRKPVEIVEPAYPSRWRFVPITLFLLGMMLRSMAARLWPPWAKTSYTPLQNARRLRSFMERMGGLWVKAGQIVALRRDLFAEEFCSELTRLQDRARGFPGHYARRIIEEDLGRSVEEIFDDFDEAPLAAASIGQAHRARLRGSDVDVVIKIRRPNVKASFDSDLGFLSILVKLLISAGIAPQFRWDDMYTELESAILEELDYRQEAATLRRMRKNLRSHKIYVPKVFLDICSDRVLVMEMVQGTFMSEYIQVAATDPQRVQAWCKENKISPRRAGERLLLSHFRQFMEDNLYHCDLHPGNILLMRRNRITLIDFGSIGSSDKSLIIKFIHMFAAIGARDYNKVVDMLLMLAPALPDRDLTHVREKIIQCYREYESISKIKEIPYHQKSVGRVMGDIVKDLGEAEVAFPWDLLRFNRSGLTLDASLMFLMPGIDYPKILRRYTDELRERQQKSLRRPGLLRTQLASIGERIDMPAKLAENAYFEGEYLRRRALKYEGYISKASQIGGQVFLTLSRFAVLAACAVVVVLLQQRYGILDRLRGTWLYGSLERLPRWGTLIWIVVMGGFLYVSIEMAAIKRILETSEPSKTGGDRR